MKRFLATAMLLVLVGCASDPASQGFRLAPDVNGPFAVDSLSLPRLEVTGVTYDDGVQREEALTLSRVYFRKILGSCGGPEEPIDRGEWWMVTCGTGYLWRQVGRLWFSTNGAHVVYEITGRFKKDRTRDVLKNLRYQFGEPAAGGNAG